MSGGPAARGRLAGVRSAARRSSGRWPSWRRSPWPSSSFPGRNHLDSADDALVLVVVTVAIASAGSRIRAFVAAIVAAASFDFLLTRPYGSFRISRSADITTEVLFVVVGLLVGELAAAAGATGWPPRSGATRSPVCTT